MKKLQNAINDPILSISWGRNSEIIFAGCGDRLCRTYDLTTNKLINNYEHLGAVGDVFWCDEISCLVAMSYDGRITFWDPRSQKAVSQINFLEEFNFKVQNILTIQYSLVHFQYVIHIWQYLKLAPGHAS